MRGGDHHAAVVFVFADCKIERVGRDAAYVQYVAAGFRRSARKRFKKMLARFAHIAPDRNVFRAKQRDEAASDLIG